MTKRNNAVDCFRAMAVILVSFYHVYRHINPHAYFFGVNLFNPILNGWMGVGIFFVISGYCMGMATEGMENKDLTFKSFTGYFQKRFFRISGPYYFSIAVWFVLITVFGIAVKPVGSYDIISHMLYIQNLSTATMFSVSGVYWSLAVEMQFYLILPLIIIFCNKSPLRIMLLCALMALTVFIHLHHRGNILLTWGIPSYLFVFVYGWVLYKSRHSLVKITGNKTFLFISVIIYIAMMFADSKAINANKFYESMTSVAFGAVMISVISMKSKEHKEENIFVKVLSFIGRASFSIYLYNYIYLALGAPSKDSTGLLHVAFILAFGVLMYYVFEVPYEKIRRNGLRKAYIKRERVSG